MNKKLSREVLRDRIARIIAATRYPFIDQENWDEDRTVIINPMGVEAWGVEGPEGLVYPGIVVLNPDGSVRELGEVEMVDSDQRPGAEVESPLPEDRARRAIQEVLPLRPRGGGGRG